MLKSNKNMDLDIPIHFSNPNLAPIRPWKSPEWINQQWNTEKTCSLCCGARVVIVRSTDGSMIKKYCLACKGLGRVFVRSPEEVITA